MFQRVSSALPALPIKRSTFVLGAKRGGSKSSFYGQSVGERTPADGIGIKLDIGLSRNRFMAVDYWLNDFVMAGGWMRRGRLVVPY